MITTCPECTLPVSDKALSCPHCGYPLKQTEVQRSRQRKRRMRLPNGFGQISEIKSGNLRNRYRAMVTVGKDESGRPICKILKPKGYFATYNEAYAALVEYNKDPYSLEDSITLEEFHEKWVEHHYPLLTGDSLRRTYDTAWKRCSKIYKMRVMDVRPKHIKACLEKAPTPVTKKMVKTLLNIMLDYAVEEGYVDRNYARTFNLDKNLTKQIRSERTEHHAFSDHELNRLWENINDVSYLDAILIQCYMGWRPRELCLLRLENVNLGKGYVLGGMKTAAGTMRIVPIHARIKDLVEYRYREAELHGRDMLINCLDSSNGELTYSKYRTRFHAAMKQLGIEGHQPHDPRKTFVTMCKRNGVDEYAIKRMVGHTIADVTESVYTERDLAWFKTEIAKI